MTTWLTLTFDEMQVYAWEQNLGYWFFYLSLLFLVYELVRLWLRKSLNKSLLGDTVTNFITFAGFLGILFLMGGLYVSSYYYLQSWFSPTHIPINVWTIGLCIVLADVIYYWEHRFMHRVGFGWATHTVHHSSPFFNISVAYRFGPLDGFFPWFFHLPLILAGFNPIVVFFAEMFVQLYQTALHTEVVGKFPKWVEAIMNTPSHHRVHHGSNPEYLDKNYAGVFIIWDKLFGTFEAEMAPVTYGLTEPVNTVNPVIVFFHGLSRLWTRMTSGSLKHAMGCFFMPPDWNPQPKPSASPSGGIDGSS